MLKKLAFFVVIVLVLVVLGVVLIFNGIERDYRERNTVIDSKGNRITTNIDGDPQLKVEWVDSSRWFDEEQDVGSPFYESLAPAKPACPGMDAGQQAVWDKIKAQECSVVLFDTDRHAFRFLGFVQRHYGESDSGTDMRSAVLNLQDKYGKQFIRSGRYNF